MSKAPKSPKQGGSRAAAKKKKQQDQIKQIALLTAVLAVCAGMITWTVMIMRQRIAENNILNEQSSTAEIIEMSSWESSEEEGTHTSVPEFTEETFTTTTEETTESGLTETTRQTDATAPPKVSVQDPHFIKVTTTKSKTTGTGTGTGTGGSTTTHTEAQGVPANAPTEQQLPYNYLLALYLGAQEQGGSAYFADGLGDSEPTVVLHGTGAYYVSSAADDYSTYNWLGGSGGTAEHPWQTDSAFRIYQYDDTNRYLYYTSQGNNYEVIGYYDLTNCENVWARLHYYQLGVGWQAEYHIMHCKRPDSLSGTQSELYNGTFDTDQLYSLSEEFLQTLIRELQNRGIPAGSWAGYSEITANAHTDTLRAKAGSYNTGFSPQSGEVCGAVFSRSGAVTLLGTDPAVLPDGALLSIPKAALPIGNGNVSVSALSGGAWVSGSLSGTQILAWSDH